MTINKSVTGTTMTVKVEGRLDTMTAPELEKALKDSIGTITELILDFENLAYVSSAGLRVLLSAQKIMNKQGSMVIRNACETVTEVFEVTGFSEILTVE